MADPEEDDVEVAEESSDEAAAESEPSEDAASESTQTLVVIDADDEARSQVEDFGESLGAAVITIDPDEFDLAEFDDFEDASAVMIDWDLGTRCGVDLLEALRSAAKTAALPIIVAASSPTDRMVRSVLRAGAQTLVSKPYQAEDLRARLDSLVPTQ